MTITDKYRQIFTNPLSPKVYLAFFQDVIYSKKVTEIFSFAIWELLYKLGYYRKENHLNLSAEEPLSIDPSVETVILPAKFQGYVIEEFEEDNWEFVLVLSGIEVVGICKEKVFRKDLSTGETTLIYTFSIFVKSAFVSSEGVIFVASDGVICRSDDKGHSFTPVLTLCSPQSFFLLNNGFAELPEGELLIGEYASLWMGKGWQSAAYYYHSKDNGLTWEKLSMVKDFGANKHMHIIKYSELLGCVLMTDGDNYKKLWINYTRTNLSERKSWGSRDGWHLVNKFHFQKGGYTSLAETKTGLLLGSDYLGGTNFMVSTCDTKKFKSRLIPDPYRRCPVINMVTIHTPGGKEIWASLYGGFGGAVKCLLMYTTDEGLTWHRFLEYDGSNMAIEIISLNNTMVPAIYISLIRGGVRKMYRIGRD